MGLQQLLQPFPFMRDILWRVTREQRQNPHRLEDTRHLVVGARRSGVGKKLDNTRLVNRLAQAGRESQISLALPRDGF